MNAEAWEDLYAHLHTLAGLTSLLAAVSPEGGAATERERSALANVVEVHAARALELLAPLWEGRRVENKGDAA